MGSMRSLVPVALLCLLALQLQLASSSSDAPPRCSMDYSSLAFLSCQETAPEKPTGSCCSALLYAIDTAPVRNADKGLCCLCSYLALKRPRFDLAGSYVACHGKDATSVAHWRQQLRGAPAPNCDVPCGREAAAPLSPPPLPPSSSGGAGEKEKKTTQPAT
ncbi:hypothetical protein EJB05_52599 [Eragrostis curvula]|uniref:Bifunctional inhibitor/plant lipid transfer protein/seed storage helical domain-containing protein n=1 Tax=Eragrostis curvula TaxID=38414 RepID=A0A5J9SSJ5_9POAL|nr:hypothetical protein EJB05_55640 [Eragrostis curvula]TVU01950.1 hypothetical protein EJB05_52599 [Eragrostis curvula]